MDNEMARRVRDISNRLVDKSTVVRTVEGEYCQPELTVQIHGDIYYVKSNKIVYSLPLQQYLLKTLACEVKDFNGREKCNFYTTGSHIIEGINKGEIILVPELEIEQSFHCTITYAKQFLEESYAGACFLNPESEFKITEFVKYRPFNNVRKPTNLNLKDRIKFGISSPSFTLTEGVRRHFGVEIETSAGEIPAYISKDLNLKCEYDGSLRTEEGVDYGGEYVTGILQGDAGLSQLHTICHELARRTTFNTKCGLHVHIEAPTKASFPTTMYKLGLDVQDEIFRMLPSSRARNPFCRPLQDYFSNNKKLFTERLKKEDHKCVLNAILYDDYLNKTGEVTLARIRDYKENPHPARDRAGYRHENPRYSWLNLLPTLFKRTLNTEYLTDDVPTPPSGGLRAAIRPTPGTNPGMTNGRVSSAAMSSFDGAQIMERLAHLIASLPRPIRRWLTDTVFGPTHNVHIVNHINNNRGALRQVQYLIRVTQNGGTLTSETSLFNPETIIIPCRTGLAEPIYLIFTPLTNDIFSLGIGYKSSNTIFTYMEMFTYRHGDGWSDRVNSPRFTASTIDSTPYNGANRYLERLRADYSDHSSTRFPGTHGYIALSRQLFPTEFSLWYKSPFEEYEVGNDLPPTTIDGSNTTPDPTQKKLEFECSPYTVEFRPHSPTTNFIKIKNWVLICMALVEYADKYEDQVWDTPAVKLEQVLKTIYPKTYTSLLQYVQDRTSLFANNLWDKNKKGVEIETPLESTSSKTSIQNLKMLT